MRHCIVAWVRPPRQACRHHLSAGSNAVASGRTALGKKPTIDMLADLLTKTMDQTGARMVLGRMNYYFRDSRHPLALNV